MASQVIKRIREKAEKLRELREEIAKREEAHKAELEGLKLERDALQGDLLTELQKQELSSIKTESGESYTRAKRVGITVQQHLIRPAIEWAYENGVATVDKVRAAQKLRDMEELPRGFIREETEYISVRKPKKND